MRWIGRLVWLAVGVLILAILGRWLAEAPPTGTAQQAETVPVLPPVDWSAVDGAIVEAVRAARQAAEAHADARLQAWVDEMMQRVDADFLDWYFDYWNQQWLGLKALAQYGWHALDETQPTAAERIAAEVEAAFARVVLQPQLAELRLRRIVRETVAVYVETLRQRLDALPARYGIPPAQWTAHLNSIALTVRDVEGDRQVPLTLKALTAAGAGGTLLLAGKIKAMLGKLSAKTFTKASGKMAAKLAAKAGGEAAAKAGGKLLGATLGIGIILWDVWDHRRTEEENRPILRQAIAEHLQALRETLLHDPEYGLMRTFYDLERQVARQLSAGAVASVPSQQEDVR